MEWLLHVECRKRVNWIWGISYASLSAINIQKVSLPPLIPGGAAALLVSEYEYTFYLGLFMTLEATLFFLLFFCSVLFLFVIQCEVRLDKAVPGFECSIKIVISV